MYKLLESSNVPEDQQISISLEDGYETEFVKTASKRNLPKEVDEVIKGMNRRKNHSYMLVTAMGDGETWGDNKNHDYFPNQSLLGLQNTPVWDEINQKEERLDPKLPPKQRYRTFDDADYYRHHKNKKEKGDPTFGYVERAIWNPRMNTVLLIIGVDETKAPDTVERIKRNELIAVSMGAKLPWDRCSICKKKHTSILQYCPDLKYRMGQTLPDGRKVYAENLFPRFFDISEVFRPAFLAGMQLEKVASNGLFDYSIDLAEIYDIGQFDKFAEVEKHSTLYKELPTHIEGSIAKVCNTEKDLPHELMNDLAKMKPQEAWGALTHAGIIAKPNEFAYILMKHNGRDDLAEKFIRTKAIVKNPDVKGLDEELHHLVTIDINHNAVKLSNQIPEHILNDRSIGSLENRIYDTDKGLRKEAEVVSTIGLGSILSALYLLYRRNVEDKFSIYGILGAGISQIVRGDEHSSKYLSNNPFVADELNKHAAESFWKSGKGLAVKGFGGFAAPYIMSAHYQNKIDQGQPVGTLGRLVANNPGKLGIVGGAMALAGPKKSYEAVKGLVGDVASGLNKLRKG